MLGASSPHILIGILSSGKPIRWASRGKKENTYLLLISFKSEGRKLLDQSKEQAEKR